MTKVSMAMKPLVILIILAAWLTGCTQPILQADLPEISSSSVPNKDPAVVVLTPHYRIYACSNKATAEEMGVLLESAYRVYSNVLGHGGEHDKFDVYAYNDRGQYQQAMHALNLPIQSASGIYTPGEKPGIHLPLVTTNRTHPFFTLVHEGLNQYLHHIKGLTVPVTTIKLPAIPVWLNEGLALYVEAAIVSTHKLAPGRIHPTRLKHLQRLLSKEPAPSLATILGKSYDAPFTNDDYSISWGVVHYLQTNHLWHQFWSKWLDHIEKEKTVFFKQHGRKNRLTMQQLWAQRLGQISLQMAENTFVGPENWSIFQENWQKSMLQLTSGQ